MLDAEDQMLCTKSNRTRAIIAVAVLNTMCALTGVASALAQEPPTTIPAGGPPSTVGAIPFDGWLLYPSLGLTSQYSNNYFLAPQSKISGWGFGEAPSLTAEWSNGIHTTTLFGSFDHIDYPTQNEIDTNDGEATFTQKYAPTRDLSFTFLADYTHQTISSGLINSIPTSVSAPSTTVLANGNSVLPNGLIVSPSGQIVGQSVPSLYVNGVSVVNPFDQYTTSGQVDKIFGDGIISLNDTLRRTDYVDNPSENFTANSISGSGSAWLGPVLYAYANGTFVTNKATAPIPDSQVYRAVGGLGTRQVGLFRASVYFGRQGSDSVGSPWAGGNVYGGVLSYYPTPVWTLSASIDRTINIAPGQTSPTNFAITIPVPTPLQVPLSSSSAITATTVRSDYKISEQWSTSGTLGYTHVQDIGTPTWDDAWLADIVLRYEMWRDLTLSLEYQYSTILTNVPLQNANRDLVTMSAVYRF